MKTFIRWLQIVFRCRLGHHLPFAIHEVAHDVTIYECPRCEWLAIKHRGGFYWFNRVSAWEAAQGKYDSINGTHYHLIRK